MATGKTFYWIKLKENFMQGPIVDFLMSQPEGANYIVLYLMLCMMTLKSGGELSSQIGEMIIPYDVEKIRRESKWFSVDTIRVALELFRQIGLIYEENNGILRLSDYGDMVGSETDWKAQKRAQREKKKNLLASAEKESELLSLDSHKGGQDDGQEGGQDCGHVHTEIRDKRLEIRDIDTRDREEEYTGVVRGEYDSFPRRGAGTPFDNSEKVSRKSYGESGWVKLTDDEYSRLLSDLGKAELTRCINYVDESAQITQNKNKWKDWNRVLRKCSREGWGKNYSKKQEPQYSYEYEEEDDIPF